MLYSEGEYIQWGTKRKMTVKQKKNLNNSKAEKENIIHNTGSR